jgi:stress-induced morphogen
MTHKSYNRYESRLSRARAVYDCLSETMDRHGLSIAEMFLAEEHGEKETGNR